MEELEVQQELRDQLGSLTFSPPPMKKSDTRDSISSVDSDVSLSFDRRGSKGEDADLSDSGSSDSERKSGHVTNDKDKKGSDSGADSFDDTIPRKEFKEAETYSQNTDITKQNPDVDFIPPDEELADKICAQVEFYFSDENIIKDAFLLKHVKRNKEGYVSLKLISSFKRVKHLSRDWRVVGAALARSKKLQVNDLGTKLRRLDPLPQFDQTTPSRTILVAKLPVEKLTIESVAELFKSCGEIALIRVLRPGHPAPTEVRQAIAKRPELASNEECAMIEFTDSAAARTALKMSLGETKIFELQSVSEKKKKQQPSKKPSNSRIAKEENYHSSSCTNGSDAEDGRIKHKRLIHVAAPPPPPLYPPLHIYQPHPYQAPPSPETWIPRRLSACSISSTENGFILRRLSSCSGSGLETGNFNRRFSSCSSSSDGGYCPPMYPTGFCQQNRRFSCCSNSGSSSGSTSGPECGNNPCFNHARRGSADCGPFIRKLSTCSRDSGFEIGSRRLSSCSSGSDSAFFRPRSNSNIIIPHLPENITRLPSGPDGTRGFGRPPRLNTAKSQVEPTY